MTIFCSLETSDSAKECNGEKKTNYKSKVQKTLRFWISIFRIPQVLNQDRLKLSFFAPKFFCKKLDFDGILLQRVKIWANSFTNRLIWKHFLCNASNFVSMKKNVYNFKPNIYKSSNFDTRFAQRIRFWNYLSPPLSLWIEKTTKHQILGKHWFWENRIRWKFESIKSIFGVNSHRKNKKVSISVVSWKSWFCETLFCWRKKNNSRIRTSNGSDI